jgi:hypothetical protein
MHARDIRFHGAIAEQKISRGDVSRRRTAPQGACLKSRAEVGKGEGFIDTLKGTSPSPELEKSDEILRLRSG